MNCVRFEQLLPLLLYDELTLEDENALHEHMQACDRCREAYVREQSVHQALDEAEAEVPADLLVRCRTGLRRGMENQGKRPGFWRRLWDLEIPVPGLLWKPAGALALVALGFFGARVAPFPGSAPAAVAARVRSIDVEPSGAVKLVLDETRQRTMTGSLRDEGIREWLLAAAKDSDPGLRVESIGILKDQADATDVREALLATVQNDPNPGVRMKALEGLRRYASDPETRKALSHVLLTDENPGIRTQAIDMMTQQRERDSVGLLQELVHKENNPYVRQRCQRALRDMNASLETF